MHGLIHGIHSSPTRYAATALIMSIGIAFAVQSHAGELLFSDETGLINPDDDASGQFGTAVAIDGAVAVIGSPVAIVGNVRPGSATVFTRAGPDWIATETLTANDGSDSDLFGQSADVSGDTIVIGAPKADVDFVPDQGAAYVFRRDSGTGLWSQQAKLTAFDSVAGDEFGRSVAIDGDLIVVGSNLVSVDGQEQRGAGYVFRRSVTTGAWIQESKLIAPDGQSAFELFGTGVSISGETIAVGSPGSDIAFQDQGAVYVFQFNPPSGLWFWQDKLSATDGGQSDSLGSGPGQGVAIQGDIIVAGAQDHGLFGAGAAYVFRREIVGPDQVAWAQEAKLEALDGDAGDNFGFAVALSGGSALIGAPFADDAGVLQRGAGYYFTRSINGVWRFRQKLVAAGDQASENGGRSLALSGTAALLGRPFAEPDGQQPDAGAVSAWSCGDLIFTDGAETFAGCGL